LLIGGLKPDSRERLCSSVVFPNSNTMKLYVGNLSFESTENDLQDLFEQHGQVSEVRLMMDRMTGKSRGFAFVTIDDNAHASAAMSALNGHELNGRALTVNEARPREERPRPGGGGGGRRSFANNRR
jgi:cold-inducible RNA-binding protein